MKQTYSRNPRTPSPVITCLKKRMVEVKPRLPHDWRKQYFAAFPQYNTAQGYRKVENCFRLISTDEKLINFLEALINEPV